MFSLLLRVSLRHLCGIVPYLSMLRQSLPFHFLQSGVQNDVFTVYSLLNAYLHISVQYLNLFSQLSWDLFFNSTASDFLICLLLGVFLSYSSQDSMNYTFFLTWPTWKHSVALKDVLLELFFIADAYSAVWILD